MLKTDLSDGSLAVDWIGELLGSNEAKLRVRLGSSLDGDGDVDEACSTYDFRMVHLAAAEGAAAAAQAGWMVKAVSKL